MPSFRIVFGDHELVLPLAFEPHIEEQLALLIRSTDPETPAFKELSRRFTDSLAALIENNVALPTEKQIKYAVAIARELSLQLSPEVLQFRESMQVFLSTHAETYRRRKFDIRK